MKVFLPVDGTELLQRKMCHDCGLIDQHREVSVVFALVNVNARESAMAGTDPAP